MNRRDRGMVLLLVLTSLVLVVATVTPLATWSGVESLLVESRAVSLRHRLAAESVIALLPALVEQESLQRDLTRTNLAFVAFECGPVSIEVEIQDDSAKLPINGPSDRTGAEWRLAALDLLSHRLAVPILDLAAPNSSADETLACLDDAFEGTDDRAMFGGESIRDGWISYLTPFGETVNLQHAESAVLESLLSDLDPELGRRMASQRRAGSADTVEDLLQSLDLPAALRERARKRLSNECRRYSLLVRTQIGHDVRRRYFVCSVDDPPQVLVDWEVAP